MKKLWTIGFTLATVVVAGTLPAQADSFVYRVVNGYNREVAGHVRQAISPATTPQGRVFEVSVDTPALGLARTEIYTPQGQWLRRTIDNHGIPVEYVFSASALPVVPSVPATTETTWSVRVPARVTGESKDRSVRIDGRVLGNERIRVPAGEFDTVKIGRVIYAGDADYFVSETRIVETDWYAPALGRSVRTETRSTWRDTRSGCRRVPSHCDFRGDWFIHEMTEAPRAAAP